MFGTRDGIQGVGSIFPCVEPFEVECLHGVVDPLVEGFGPRGDRCVVTPVDASQIMQSDAAADDEDIFFLQRTKGLPDLEPLGSVEEGIDGKRDQRDLGIRVHEMKDRPHPVVDPAVGIGLSPFAG